MGHIRRAVFSDAEGIATIQVQGWHTAYKGIIPKKYLEQMTLENRIPRWQSNLFELEGLRQTLVYEERGEILAFACTGHCRDTDKSASHIGELWALYVRPDAWRRGIGMVLFDEAKAFLEGVGISQICLWVLEENHQARTFYEAQGFYVDGLKKEFGDGDNCWEVRMVLEGGTSACEKAINT